MLQNAPARMTEIVLVFFTHDVAGAIFHIFIIVIRSRNNIDGANSFFCFWFRAWMFEAVVADSAGRIIVFASANLFVVFFSVCMNDFFLVFIFCIVDIMIKDYQEE